MQKKKTDVRFGRYFLALVSLVSDGAPRISQYKIKKLPLLRERAGGYELIKHNILVVYLVYGRCFFSLRSSKVRDKAGNAAVSLFFFLNGEKPREAMEEHYLSFARGPCADSDDAMFFGTRTLRKFCNVCASHLTAKKTFAL